MFSNLEDQIRLTNGQPVNRIQHLLRLLGVLGVTAVLFGSLYLGILLLE